MNNNSVFKRRNTYSSIVFILVLVSEVIVVAGLKFQIEEMVVWPLMVLVPIILLGIIGWFYAKQFFLPQSTVFSDLMANAIAPTWLGAFYLLFFVVHITWISDGSLNLFRAGFDDVNEVAISVLTGLIGMFCLICFFPEARKGKGEDEHTKVFVSGISIFPSTPNPYTKEPTSYEMFNLRPLVRVLQLAEDKLEKCELLILKTNKYETNVGDICISDAEDIKLNSFENSDFVYYGVTPERDCDDNLLVDSKLRLIIKKVAWKEFVEKATEEDRRKRESWVKHDIAIHFTSPCDYDEFIPCFKTLRDTLENYNEKNHKLIFNLTPGTVVISSIVTLLSIDSGRELYYYRQNKGIIDSERLKRIEKKKIPLENLLSQALQTIKER